MAYVTITYGNHFFEENPGLVTWLQLYLIRRLAEEKAAPEWTQKLAEDLELNAEIDIYKYFYDEDVLDDPEKKQWAREFTSAAVAQLENMTLKEFSEYIGERIDGSVDYERVKKILLNVELMLEDKSPVDTFPEE